MFVVKIKERYVCQNCGAESTKWLGRCVDCAAWNSITQEAATPTGAQKYQSYAGKAQTQILTLDQVALAKLARISTGLKELDYVLGGGLVEGSVVLIGGDPGVGKSTLLLQCVGALSNQLPVLYVSGEESLQQIAMRAKRLEVQADKMQLLAQTQVELILATAAQHKPKVLVIDSIQTLYSQEVSSAPGSVGQVRESSARLVRYAKETGTTIFLVGHVTKEGALAGPRVLEHMVDAVLYFEGQRDNRFRMVRAVKNRFGAVNELGVFAMTDRGLREVNNPSAIFLQPHEGLKSGSVVMAAWEGSRSLLVEVQALVSDSYLDHPRRVAVGLDQNRLAMLLAVLHRHGGVGVGQQDVFVNVVGGVRVIETASDLALLMAVLSSYKDKPTPLNTIVFGEVGLSGEIRPVQSGLERLREAAKHGIKHAIVPKGNMSRQNIKGLSVTGVSHIREVLGLI